MASKEAASEWMKLLDKIEPLHPDLAPYLFDWDAMPGAKMVHHKLVISLPHHDMQNAMINKGYEYKLKAVEQAIADSDWHKFVFLHERPYRADALMEVLFEHAVNDPDVIWPLIASVWNDCENVNENFDLWQEIWDQDIPGREKSMDEDERAALAALPDLIPIFRGVGHRDAVSGMSWSTSREKAEWFARRYSERGGHTPILAIGVVEKKNVIAHQLRRNEFEIVASPDDVEITDVVTVKTKR